MKHLVTLIVRSLVLLQCVCEECWSQLTSQSTLADKQIPVPGNQSDSNETDDQSQCLMMTYNSTKQIYTVPYFVSPGYNYKIWFRPLKGEESISIQFDFSLPGTMADFPNHASSHSVIPLQWHELEIVAGKGSPTECRRWAELKIPDLDVNQCLPHHSISRIQVSSPKNLVMWSTCNPQGNWWEDMAGHVIENSHPETSTYVLIACLAAALIGLVIVGVYACYLRTSGRRNTANEDTVYAEWSEIQHQKPMTITPPSSASYHSKTGTINTFLSS